MDKITYVLIYELFELKQLLENHSTIDDSEVSSAINEVTEVAQLLYEENNNAIDKLHYLFVPGSILSNVSKSNEWEQEFEYIKEKVTYLIGIIRTQQKNDPSNFNNIKGYNNGTYASMPGRLTVSQQKWKEIQKSYKLCLWSQFKMNILFNTIQEHLNYGDTQPAVVVSLDPFIVAAYSDEMDAVVLLQFPVSLVRRYQIKLYDRMVSINKYLKSFSISKDIFIGENYLGNWTNFKPLIGDFLSTNTTKLEQHKKNIPEFLWIYVQTLGEVYLRDHKNLVRNGFWFINKKE